MPKTYPFDRFVKDCTDNPKNSKSKIVSFIAENLKDFRNDYQFCNITNNDISKLHQDNITLFPSDKTFYAPTGSVSTEYCTR